MKNTSKVVTASAGALRDRGEVAGLRPGVARREHVHAAVVDVERVLRRRGALAAAWSRHAFLEVWKIATRKLSYTLAF